MRKIFALMSCFCLLMVSTTVFGAPGKQEARGLNPDAMAELADAGVDKYMGEFTPISSVDVGEGWTKHTFDPDGGAGPICVAGTPFSAFSKGGNPSKLLIMLQGGGACWQDFYFCNILAEDQEPPPPPTGIWADSYDTGDEVIPNPLGKIRERIVHSVDHQLVSRVFGDRSYLTCSPASATNDGKDDCYEKS